MTLDSDLGVETAKRWLYRGVGIGLRIYVACLVGVGVYSIFWLAEIAGYLDENTLATIWLAIAGMGAAFLVLLIPIFYTSRRQ